MFLLCFVSRAESPVPAFPDNSPFILQNRSESLLLSTVFICACLSPANLSVVSRVARLSVLACYVFQFQTQALSLPLQQLPLSIGSVGRFNYEFFFSVVKCLKTVTQSLVRWGESYRKGRKGLSPPFVSSKPDS